MKTRLTTFATVLILAALLLNGCTRAVVRPTDTPAPTPEPAPAEVIAARDAALAYIRQNFADQAPAAGLAWAARRATPEQILGAETYEFASGGWVILISYPIVRPDLTIYKIAVVNTAADFSWEGQVDVQGHVAAAPGGVLHALRAALGYLAFNEPDKAPDPYLPWAETRTTPEGIVGAETYEYAAGAWTVTVSYPVVAPSAMIYTVVVENKADGLRWEATVEPTGLVTFAPDEPSEEGGRVDGWIGIIVQLPPGNQFGQYFLRADGEKYDIGSADDAIRSQIAQLRGTDQQVKVWGTLFVGVPATEARHIEVSRIEVVPQGN